MSLVVTINQRPGGEPSLGPALTAIESAVGSLDVDWSCRAELAYCPESGVPRNECVGCRNVTAEAKSDDELDRELVRQITEQLRHLNGRLPALGDAGDEPTVMLDHVLDEWEAFVDAFDASLAAEIAR